MPFCDITPASAAHDPAALVAWAKAGARTNASQAACLDAAVRLRPMWGSAYLALGNVLRAAQDLSLSEQSFRRAIALAPAGDVGCAAADGLGTLLQAAARVNEAEALARGARASTIPSHCPTASHHMARLLRRRGAHAEAVFQARAALGAAPAHRAFQLGLANALHGAGAFEEAIALYRVALTSVEGAGHDHRTRLDLAHALGRAGNAAESLDAYATALPVQLAEVALRLPPAPSPSAQPERGAQRGRIVFYCRLRAHADFNMVDTEVSQSELSLSVRPMLVSQPDAVHLCHCDRGGAARRCSVVCTHSCVWFLSDFAPRHRGLSSGVGTLNTEQSRVGRFGGGGRLRFS